MTKSTQQTIEEQLRQAWRKERRFHHIRGASRLAIWLFTLILLGLIIDWGVFFPARISSNATVILSIIGALTLAWVLWDSWLRHLKAYNPVHMALEVEAKHPELMSSLVTYTQMKGPVDGQDGVSDELIAAMRDHAIQQTQKLDFRAIIDFGQLKKLLGYTAVGFVVLAALSFQWPEHWSVYMNRLVGVDTQYPTRTQITDISGDMFVRVGDTATIMVHASGVIPDEGTLYVKKIDVKGAKWTKLPMQAVEGRSVFTRELTEIHQKRVYYIDLGDERSATFHIQPIGSPSVVNAKLALSYPSYIGRADAETDQLNLEVPEGTTINWQLECNPAVKKLTVMHGNKTLDATLDKSGRKISFSLEANAAFNYTFKWTERETGNDFEYEDVQFTVKVVRDTPPEINVYSRKANAVATVKKQVVLPCVAKDDHGLDKAWLVYSIEAGDGIEGAGEKRIEIQNFGNATSKKFLYTWDMAKSIPDIQPGMNIIYWVESKDLKPKGGKKHFKRSQMRKIGIVEKDEYTEWFRSQLTAQNNDIKRAYLSELASSKQVKQLKAEEGSGN